MTHLQKLAVKTMTDYTTNEKVSKLHNVICRNTKEHRCYSVNLLKSSATPSESTAAAAAAAAVMVSELRVLLRDPDRHLLLTHNMYIMAK